ncbi:MAG: tRNA uridine-5-carboxymethylaminomethyl(34) synthesis enzyme MnmG, partial [Crocinitomicaceae bacterium]|nr:tRNA uridine-5-carboxymethylaminomethyl(34) synthesis enzyme MnmG [Crocinitomicaceae bacterium]
RMFTSRAEYRILLRQDNADIRLTPLGYKIGLAGQEAFDKTQKKIKATQELIGDLKKIGITPKEVNPFLESKGSAPISQQVKLSSIITRPNVYLKELIEVSPLAKKQALIAENHHCDVVSQTEIQMKYEGYIEREQEQAEKMLRLEKVSIPTNMTYNELNSLSSEGKEKLSEIKPTTIGQASRVSGVTPSDISVLLVYLGR